MLNGLVNNDLATASGVTLLVGSSARQADPNEFWLVPGDVKLGGSGAAPAAFDEALGLTFLSNGVAAPAALDEARAHTARGGPGRLILNRAPVSVLRGQDYDSEC